VLDDAWRVLASIIGVNPNEVAAMSLEERCARSIGSVYSQAYALANDESMLLNYNQLSVSVLSNVLEFFKVSPAIEELEAITRTSGVYAKELSGARPFIADAGAKQKLASDLVRELSARWANEPYQRLEEKRQ
jgi:hypothetical protein